MNIGIASCYYHHKYGSMLQAYATQKAVQELGHQATTICCTSPKICIAQSKVHYYIRRIQQSANTRDVFLRKLREKRSRLELVSHPELKVKMHFRDNMFDQFYHNHILLSEPCSNRTELTQLAAKFDAVIVGSDQLWNTANIEQDYFTLTFVPEKVKKIAYATSFGTAKISSYQQKQAHDFLERFYAISVREKSGVDVIKSIGVDKEVRVVLDPTLLIDASAWARLECERTAFKNYILCYFLGVNQQHRQIAKRIQQITGYKIIALQHLDEYVKEDENFGDIKPYDVGPSEFVDLIRNSSFVCTDSFHGTCFSILHHKRFLTMDRFSNQNNESTNTRIESLLGMVGLSSRRVTGSLPDDELQTLCEQEIDFAKADAALAKERIRSYEYLKEALET